MAEQKRDAYEILGVDKSADADTLKKAYRKLAKKYHPDANPGDKTAEEKFKEATEAYAILSDPDKKAQYDRFGYSAFDGAGGGGDGGFGGFDFSGMGMDDIFGDLFGGMFGGGSRRRGPANGPQPGANVRTSVRLTFMEAIKGCEKEITINQKDECETCHGTGAKPGSEPVTCSKCGGKGQVVYTQQSLFGMVQNVQTCPDCQGSGKIIKDKCTDCGGSGYKTVRRKISVSIPAGIDNGQMVRLRGKGEPGKNGGQRGDLLVEAVIENSKEFTRQDMDIYTTVGITFPQAALGDEIRIKTVDGDVMYTIRPGTQPGTRARLKGKGVPSVRDKNIRGDHYVTLNVQVPTRMSDEAKEALRAYDEAAGASLGRDKDDADKSGKSADKSGKKKGIFDRIKEGIDDMMDDCKDE